MERTALDGLRVLDCSERIAGPHAAKLFAELGASVVKVERPGGDPGRSLPPLKAGLDPASGEASGLFAYLNSSKRAVVLDLEDGRSRRRLLELVETADLLIESFPPGHLAGLGLDRHTLHARNPRLVLVSITPYGQDGPRSSWAATDLTIAAASGLAWGTPGKVDDPQALPPLRPAGHHTEFIAGITAAAAAIAAIVGREQTGAGQWIDISAQASAAAFMRQDIAFATYDEAAYAAGPGSRRTARGLGHRYFQGLVPCADGSFAIQAPEQYMFQQFVQLMGDPPWSREPLVMDAYHNPGEAWDRITEHIIAWTRSRTKAEIFQAAQERGIPVFPAYTIPEVLADPQLVARDHFTTVEHPVLGTMLTPGPPYRFEKTPWRQTSPAPRLGEHTAEILPGPLPPPRSPAGKGAAGSTGATSAAKGVRSGVPHRHQAKR
jgi:crotonobetainyl-CoA:carnitine CoA-transferase CaiB-like acyl-CoA transferase